MFESESGVAGSSAVDFPAHRVANRLFLVNSMFGFRGGEPVDPATRERGYMIAGRMGGTSR